MKYFYSILLFVGIVFPQNPCDSKSRDAVVKQYKNTPLYEEELKKWADNCKEYLNREVYKENRYSGSSVKKLNEVSVKTNKSIFKRAKKVSYVDALDDTLMMLHKNISDMLVEYDRMIDLKRNILKSRLNNNRMSFVYHTPKESYRLYRFSQNDIVYERRIELEPIRIFPDRITRGNGFQLIKVEAKTSDAVYPIMGFIDYKKIRNKLPKDFREIVETAAFRDYEQNKDLTHESIDNIPSDELDRWLEVTGHLLEEEIKEKSKKPPNQYFRSTVLNFVVIGLFILNIL